MPAVGGLQILPKIVRAPRRSVEWPTLALRFRLGASVQNRTIA
jgi:hypothetical protein